MPCDKIMLYQHWRKYIFVNTQKNKIKELKNLQQEYATDYQKLIEIDNQIKELEIELEHKLERWEYLNEINEQIIEYRNNKYK